MLEKGRSLTRACLGYLVGFGLLCAPLGCEEEKPAPTSAATAAPKAPPPAPSPTPAPAETAPVAKKSGERPSKIDTELTPARRAAIEAKYPLTKGFVAASEVQAKLKADKTLKDKKSGIAAFDRQAKGKWLLFTAPLVNLTDSGFDIGFEYTPQLPNDPMGMSRQFFEVSMSNVEGYDKELFKGGNLGVVLVKYNGAAKASPGYELVALGAWQ
jgi:hypothetical protein